MLWFSPASCASVRLHRTGRRHPFSGAQKNAPRSPQFLDSCPHAKAKCQKNKGRRPTPTSFKRTPPNFFLIIISNIEPFSFQTHQNDAATRDATTTIPTTNRSRVGSAVAGRNRHFRVPCHPLVRLRARDDAPDADDPSSPRRAGADDATSAAGTPIHENYVIVFVIVFVIIVLLDGIAILLR